MSRHIFAIVLTLALLAPFAPVAAAAPAAQSSADWPQLQRDPQRSGASPQSVPGPYRFYWRWNEAPLATRAQPVVAAGRLFIGDLLGRMHALDADADSKGGAPVKLWTRDLGSPIRSSAAVVGDTLVVGTQAGVVYGLNVATGAERWRFLTGMAITAAPLVTSDTIYIGSSSGVLYALSTAGALRWNYRAGGPILSSPALSADGSQIFFAAEDMQAYALDAKSGLRLWRAPLRGQSTTDSWATVSGDTVIFRTTPLRHFRDLLFRGDEVLDKAGPLRDSWEADWAAVRPLIVQHLSANPDQQTFFALNTANGTSRGVAPILYTGGNQEPPIAPAVYKGRLYLFVRPRKGIQNDSPVAVHIASKYDADLASVDPRSLEARNVAASNAFNYEWRATSDEGAQVSLAGSMLLISSWERFGAIDLASGRNIGIAQVSHNYPGCGSQCQANNNLMPFFPAPQEPVDPGNSEGASRTPAVAAAGRIFWRVGSGGLASIGPASGAAVAEADTDYLSANVPPQNAAPSSSPALAATDLRSYISAAPAAPVKNAPADLVQLLEEEVRRVIAADDHLKPLFIQRGWSTSYSWPPETERPQEGQAAITHNSSMVTGNAYWYDPGELIYSLSLTYPYLSSSTQSALKAYLRKEIARYGPFDALPFSELPWLRKGAERASYRLPFENEMNTYPPPAPPIQSIYAVWAYAEYVGEWGYVEANWNRIKSLWNARKGEVDSYARIAGAIGYYRIAQRLGKSAEAAEALEVGNAALNAGLNFGAFRQRAAALLPDMELNQPTALGVRGQVFFGLTPEVGRFLNERLRSQIDAEISARTGLNGAPIWYATRPSSQHIEPFTEQGFHGPDLAWGLFLARAYGQRADQATLRALLDRPFALGDLYYLQKVVATIQAPSGGATSAVPSLSGVKVEQSNFSSAVLRWRTSVPSSGWVEYGTTKSYGQRTPIWLAPVQEHRITVEGLLPKRTYHFRVCSTGPGGTTCSADQVVTTAEASSLFLPTIVK